MTFDTVEFSPCTTTDADIEAEPAALDAEHS